MTADHADYVRHRVMKVHTQTRYVVACECGWTSYPYRYASDADTEKARHQTQHNDGIACDDNT